MKIIINSVGSGEEYRVEVETTETIQRIKEMVEAMSGIPAVQQHLMFGGERMRGNHTVSDHNIVEGSVVDLILALQGGASESGRVENQLDTLTELRSNISVQIEWQVRARSALRSFLAAPLWRALRRA